MQFRVKAEAEFLQRNAVKAEIFEKLIITCEDWRTKTTDIVVRTTGVAVADVFH